MSAKKIKGAKKRPENIQVKPVKASLTEELQDWFRIHQGKLTISAAALVLIVLAVWGYRSYSESRDRRAMSEYAQAVKDWPADNSTDMKAWENIAGGLEKYAKDNGGTKQGLYAELDLSKADFHLKKYDEAARLAENVLGKLNAQDDLRPLARYQISEIYLAAGETDKALEQLETLRKEGLEGSMRETEWHIARLHVKKGDFAKASEEYEAALKAAGDYPSPSVIQEELASAKSRMKKAS